MDLTWDAGLIGFRSNTGQCDSNGKTIRHRNSSPARWTRAALAGDTHVCRSAPSSLRRSSTITAGTNSFRGYLIHSGSSRSAQSWAWTGTRPASPPASSAPSSAGWDPLSDELGIHVCGGRGQHSRKTPDELRLLGERIGFDGAKLTRASRLVAKVDSAAVQDGFDLYLHGFFVTDDGKWTVVQQGMNGDNKQARRYHWHSEDLKSFVDEPHSAIDGPVQGEIVNLTDKRAETSRSAQLELLTGLGPDRIVSELSALAGEAPAQALLPHLVMPAHHDVRSSDVFTRRLHGTLAAAAERGPVDFPELLLTPGVGARTVRSLAMVAEVVHGAPYRFRDPARFSLAHGGKDRHPYPVPLKVYDETIRVMKSAVLKAKLGRDEEMQALKRLDSQARRLEGLAEGPSLESFMAVERAASPALDGRSVFGWEKDLASKELPVPNRGGA